MKAYVSYKALLACFFCVRFRGKQKRCRVEAEDEPVWDEVELFGIDE